MAAPRWWVPYIAARARRLGLDPAAVLGIASHEGLSGAVGDHGTSFGPFQLHEGGALPRGKGRAWAEGKSGIDYALGRMAQVARGLHGQQAVSAISTRFERPADPASEIADAMHHYGQFGGVKGNLEAAPAFDLAARLGGNGGLPGASQGGSTDPRMAIISALLQSSNELAQGHSDPNGLLNALVDARRTAPDSTQQTNVPIPGGGALPVIHGTVTPTTQKALNIVREAVGTPYVWGGSKPGGFDCSGLLQYAWAKSGVRIPRTTYDQWQAGKRVGNGQLQAGDAVFFRGSDSKGGLPGHVGMYIGSGKFIEAPHTGARVHVSTLRGRTDYMGARRY